MSADAGQIAARYAKALFKLAEGDLSKAEKHGDALNAIKKLFTFSESGKILKSPIMPAELKKELLDYGLKATDSDDLLKTFVATVIDAGRVTTIPSIAAKFAELVNDAKGVVEAEVIAARELGESELSSVSEILGSVLKKKIDVTQTVDAALLGGFIVRVGNLLIDLSLKTKLDGLAQSAAR